MPLLVNIHHDTPAEHRRLLVAGICFLAGIIGLVWLSIAIYDKQFATVTTVTVKADRAGLQLAKFGDVRRHGVLIGQVRAIDQDGEQASITVALEPAAARELPADVGVQILPTTLFGQKFLSFVDPAAPSSEPLADGAVIPASRVETNVELNRILAELFPLLRAVRPADLSMTLNALANALDGRGERLGESLVDLRVYLDGIEGSLPTLRADLVALADVAQTYELATPDLVRVLDNLTVTGTTVLDRERQLQAFLGDVTGLADTTREILAANETDLIAAGRVGRPVLELLATYSPQLPCLLEGAARYAPVLGKTFEGNQVKQFIELPAPQYRPYDRGDLPRYGEIGHGPWCAGLPFPPVPIGPESFDDGTDTDSNPPTSLVPPPLGPGEGAAAGSSNRTAPRWAQRARDRGFGAGMSSGYAGSAGDQQVLNALLAGRTGRPARGYGSLGSLLYGPVVRGATADAAASATAADGGGR